MNTLPPEPSAKDPISATFIKALMRYIRANTILNGPGYRTNRGPNGTTLKLNPSKGVAAPAAKIPGRFEILSITANEPQEDDEEEEQERTYTVAFTNPYYDIGGKTYEIPVDEEADPPAVYIEEVKDGDLIVLKIKAGESRSEELVTVGTLLELQQLQDDVAYYSIPLYKIDGGSAVCDFRTGPISGMGEF